MTVKEYVSSLVARCNLLLQGKHAWAFWLLAAGLPFVVLAILVALFAVNVPFWDQWELVTLFQKYHDDSLGLADFVAQHNEHRLLFPRLVMFVLAVPSHWNVLLEVATNVALAAVGMFFLYKILAKTFTEPVVRWVATIAVSLILFSPLQQENWLWGWQIQWYLCTLGSIVAVWALAVWEAAPIKRVIVAALAAVVATYSLASGMFVWVICLPLLWFIKPLRRWLLPWLVLMAIAIGLHYVGYVDPAYHPSKILFLDQPVQFVRYIIVYLVHPVTIDFLWSYKMAFWYFGGIVVGLAYVFRYHRHELVAGLLPWFCIGAYACFAAVSTGISRLGFGLEQAYSSRYTTLSQFLLIAFVVILCKVIELELKAKTNFRKVARNSAVVVGLFFLCFVGLNYGKGFEQMRLKSAHLEKVKHCAQTASASTDDCLLKLYPNKDVVWQRLEYLRSIHWGGL